MKNTATTGAKHMRQMTKNQTRVADLVLNTREATDPLARSQSDRTARRVLIVASTDGEWNARVYDEFADGKIVTLMSGGAYPTRKDAAEHVGRMYPTATPA